jgi:hypothetical protein
MPKKAYVFAVGMLLLIAAAILTWLLVEHWPVYRTENGVQVLVPETMTLFKWNIPLVADPDRRLMMLVLIAGALGSFIHAATSFVSYVGNGSFVSSWAWWYLLRLPIGGATALLFYFVLRGGLLAADAEASDVSTFGFVAIAAMAGMFSKQASDKLREVFDNLWNVGAGAGDDERADKLSDPVVESLQPNRLAAGSGAVDVKVLGQRLAADSKVVIAGVTLPTKFVSGNELVFTLTDEHVADVSEWDVFVQGPGKRLSKALKITVT